MAGVGRNKKPYGAVTVPDETWGPGPIRTITSQVWASGYGKFHNESRLVDVEESYHVQKVSDALPITGASKLRFCRLVARRGGHLGNRCRLAM